VEYKKNEIYLPTISYGRIPYNENLHENTHLLTKKYIISLHKTYSDFIIEFFNNYNFNCITISENGNYICDKDRRRSLHDLYLITKYYYPEITFKDIISTVVSLINLKLLNGQYCNTVGKYVLYTNHKSRYNEYYGALELTKEFNFDDLKKYIENEK